MFLPTILIPACASSSPVFLMMYSAYKLNKIKFLKNLIKKIKEVRKLGSKEKKKTKIMASSPITSWQIDGETMKTVTDFIFLGSKITTDGDCSHEIKRHLLLGRKVMTDLDSILKNRDILCHQRSI